MGVLDKIKNALFEVEYVEVEEPPKKEKKIKEKKKEKVKEKMEEKPIAKKIVLPGKREGKVEELHEEELRDEDFEIRPKHEHVKETSHDEFKFMDDDDFKMDGQVEEPEIVHVIDENEEFKDNYNDDVVITNNTNTSNNISMEQHHVSREQKSRVSNEVLKDDFIANDRVDSYSSSQHYGNDNYSVNSNTSSNNSSNSKLYGVDSSYKIPAREYGIYEKKDEHVGFKPSPIISPIYGILDKNYKKEDVVTKSEVRITTNYTRTNVSVDDIRNKAYGERKSRLSDLEKEKEKDEPLDTSFEVEDDEDENLLVDLSDKTKPEVKEITMGDALEYFQDLGLEYNVDYVDVSNEKKNARSNMSDNGNTNSINDVNVAESKKSSNNENEKVDDIKLNNIVDIRQESNDNDGKNDDDNDNLFDLIDSMYQENE